jgi:hypothetical protein
MQSRIFDGSGMDITGANKLTDVTTYASSSKKFTVQLRHGSQDHELLR